jgi:t-SNARE complex subunit (syntaxin)
MEELQKSMAELLQKFGGMATDVKTVTEEVHGLRQQLEDFGEDLHGVKQRLVELEKTTRRRTSGLPRHASPTTGRR